MKKYTLTFEAPDDFNPMIECACWVCCPISALIKFGEKCRAKDYYDKYGEIICPIIKMSSPNGMCTAVT